ncbi:YbaB/EbfC family nucleoid-associated protein [Streptomyces sp. NPDC002067]
MADSPSFDIGAITERMRDLQTQLSRLGEAKDTETTGHAGGGLVTAKVDSDGVLTSLRMDPSVVDPDDVQSLESLIIEAVSSAQSTLRDMRAKQVGQFTDGMLDLTAGLREQNTLLQNAPSTDPNRPIKTLTDLGVVTPPASTKGTPDPR